LATGQAICPDCYCLMNRKVSFPKLNDFHRILAITFTKAPEQVIWIVPSEM